MPYPPDPQLPEFPDQFHPEMQPGLRIALMEYVISEIRKDFGNNIGTILDEVLKNNRKLDRPGAFIFITEQLEKKTQPYTQFISNIRDQMTTTLNNAMELEKAGALDGAIMLYEKLAADAFTPSMPHDRLRILYTKRHDIDNAIRACERYINILLSYNEFNKNFSNIHLIPNYEKHIAKLKAKRKPHSDTG